MILVYQLGKAGSTSLYRELELLSGGRFAQLQYVHFLSEEVCRDFIDAVSSRREGSLDPIFIDNILGQVERARHVRGLVLEAIEKQEVVRVLCGVRNPISYCISVFSQVLHDSGTVKAELVRRAPDPGAVCMEEFRNCLTFARDGVHISKIGDPFDAFVATLFRLSVTWFENELFQIIDVGFEDILKNRDQGKIGRGSVSALIYRIEDGREVLSKRMGEFIEVADFRLGSHNVSLEKPYASIHQEFKNCFELTAVEFEWFANKAFSRCFYPSLSNEKFSE